MRERPGRPLEERTAGASTSRRPAAPRSWVDLGAGLSVRETSLLGDSQGLHLRWRPEWELGTGTEGFSIGSLCPTTWQIWLGSGIKLHGVWGCLYSPCAVVTWRKDGVLKESVPSKGSCQEKGLDWWQHGGFSEDKIPRRAEGPPEVPL